MWLSEQIRFLGRETPAGQVASVTGEASVQAGAEYRNLPQTGPWGIAWRAPVSAQAVVVDTDLGKACLGAVQSAAGLEPGELLLYSQGGAKIYLKNSGEVVINGRVFAAEER